MEKVKPLYTGHLEILDLEPEQYHSTRTRGSEEPEVNILLQICTLTIISSYLCPPIQITPIVLCVSPKTHRHGWVWAWHPKLGSVRKPL